MTSGEYILFALENRHISSKMSVTPFPLTRMEIQEFGLQKKEAEDKT
jgi:hypothetical protein